MKIKNYEEFWGFYLRAHSRRGTRALHYIGTTLGLCCLGAAAFLGDGRWIPAGFVLGYGFAWTGHFFIEGNKPATFGHPLWSFYSDFH